MTRAHCWFWQNLTEALRDHTNIRSCSGKGNQRWVPGQIIEVLCFHWRDHGKIVARQYLQSCANSRIGVFWNIWNVFLCFPGIWFYLLFVFHFWFLFFIHDRTNIYFYNILPWAVMMTIKTVLLSEDGETILWGQKWGSSEDRNGEGTDSKKGWVFWFPNPFLLWLLSHQSLYVHKPSHETSVSESQLKVPSLQTWGEETEFQRRNIKSRPLRVNEIKPSHCDSDFRVFLFLLKTLTFSPDVS